MLACKTCGENRPPEMFYASNKSRCKECVRAKVRVYRTANIERIREYDRNRRNQDTRAANCRENYRRQSATPEGRKLLRGYGKKWWRQNQEKKRANVRVKRAIQAGSLKVRPCERCGFGIGVQAHHEDYSKPLDVNWLCTRCHGKRHREINAEKRKAA